MVGAAVTFVFALALLVLVENLAARRAWRRDCASAIEDEMARRRAVHDALRDR